MFTGLVECTGEVSNVEENPPGTIITVRLPDDSWQPAVGDSIAINGCCLTVVGIDSASMTFAAGPETLQRTNLANLSTGSPVNLERSLKLSDRLGGHFVTGHVDAVAKLIKRADERDWATLWFDIPNGLGRQMAPKGSIAVDGVSLTLVEVEENRFSVALIPHTLAITTMGRLREGDAVNLETDILAKYAARQLEYIRREEAPRAAHPAVGE